MASRWLPGFPARSKQSARRAPDARYLPPGKRNPLGTGPAPQAPAPKLPAPGPGSPSVPRPPRPAGPPAARRSGVRLPGG